MRNPAVPTARIAFTLACAAGLLASGALLASAFYMAEESERQVKESEVPRPALDALKKVAGKAPIKGFSEEIEHGHKFYEGSWAGPNGNVDCLVTEAGDFVELEEIVPVSIVPASVRNAAEAQAGKSAAATYEKKTLVMYEVHFKKDGRGHELIFTPDGRPFHEDGDDHNDKNEKDDDKDD